MVKFNTKADMAYEILRRDIVEGKFRPGDKINISSVARELQLSGIPIREALQRLESEGMVENTPHIGFAVTQPEFAKYTDVFAVRQLLEGEAAALCAKNITPEALEELGRLVDEMDAATQAGEMDLLTKLNYQFHHLVYSSCGNSTLVRLVEQVWSIYPRTRSIFKMVPQRMAEVHPEHEAIYRAIKNGDSEGARRALLTHKQRSYDLLVNCLVEDQDALENAG